MKKTLTIGLLLFLGLSIFSCSKEKKIEPKEETMEHTEMMEEVKKVEKDSTQAVEKDSTEAQLEAVYQCPMKCEEEKTYAEAGSCPVCKMDLKELKS